MSLVTYPEVNGTTCVRYENGANLGTLYQEVDGFWVYEPELKGGYWPAHLMHAIANELDRRNTPIQAQLDAYFDAESENVGIPYEDFLREDGYNR
jgi:hypothetical protein